jgi:hypothetical protein
MAVPIAWLEDAQALDVTKQRRQFWLCRSCRLRSRLAGDRFYGLRYSGFGRLLACRKYGDECGKADGQRYTQAT